MGVQSTIHLDPEDTDRDPITIDFAAIESLQNGAETFDCGPYIFDDSLRDAIKDLEPWLTAQDAFQDVSRGNPKPHSLSEEKRKEVGLTRDTWKLEVISDPDHPARIRSLKHRTR